MSPPDGRRGRPLDRETPPADQPEVSVTPPAEIDAEAWWREANAAIEILADIGIELTPTDILELVGRRWWLEANAAIAMLAGTGDPFTADDVHETVGKSPRQQTSSLFAVAVRRGLIKPIGSTVGFDGRLLRIWRGAQR
jgi:hypothetical protein